MRRALALLWSVQGRADLAPEQFLVIRTASDLVLVGQRRFECKEDARGQVSQRALAADFAMRSRSSCNSWITHPGDDIDANVFDGRRLAVLLQHPDDPLFREL